MRINLNLSFFELLTIFLVVGKLSDNLEWRWGAVFAPLIVNATYLIVTSIYDYIKFRQMIEVKKQVVVKKQSNKHES